MAGCTYRFNPSEQYQKQVPGGGVETHCGGATYPICDEPEMVPVTVRDGSGDVRTEYQHTGEYLPRETDDPYCPDHGGTPAPPPRVLTRAELISHGEQLEAARRDYVAQLQLAGVHIPESLQPAPALPGSEGVS